jgi:CheY-like chemotaxis protein
MTAARGAFDRNLLLIEPDGLVRGTVASVCRDLQIARVRQETSIASAEQWLKTGAPHALLMSLAEGDAALDFLTRLRAGAVSCDAGLPVVAMTRAVDAVLVTQIKALNVRRLLLQPFKLHEVIHTLEQLWPAHDALPA